MTHLPDETIHPRFAVALSGGVDSAVAAALLKEGGADVVAFTMRLQKGDRTDDAVQVAAALDIPHHVIDLTERFALCVMGPFAESYARGETPSPCVRCNRLIKFGALIDAAKEQGTTALVTGHYVRRVETDGGAQLHTGSDPVRDQSYFLSALTQEQIDFMRVPLGAMDKSETRALALRYKLPVAHKLDSQDICFVEGGDYAAVVKRFCPDAFQAGEIVDQAGCVLGHHQGLAFFTVGQRKGLSLGHREGDHNDPLFVLSLEPKNNKVIVGPREALARRIVHLQDVNWLGDDVPAEGLCVTTKLRSAQAPLAARFYAIENGGGTLHLDAPTYGVAKGQRAALYDGSRLLGGGWIVGSE
ncbi:MAG: tRNA 2-thiouridine(34) synthase MnmA [Bdellovibrionales bacterium]|jgi:tRNA-specific 2-thiouridylase